MSRSSNLSLRSMKIFLAVFDTGSVGHAARALGMSQSGLSTALTSLRRELGDVLFVSTSSGMQPSARAKDLVGPMRDTVNCIEQRILKKEGFDPATEEREFRIALTDVAEAIYMPRALNAVVAVAPGVRIRSVTMPPHELQRALSDGGVDLALGYLPDLSASELVRRKIGRHAFVCLCGSANHGVIDGFNLKKYSEARHIVVEAAGRTQGLLERYVAQRGIHRRVVLTTPNVMSMPEIISHTDMIASIPDALAHFFSNYPRLVQLPLPFPSPVFDTHLHWGRSLHGDPANRWLRSVLFEAFAKPAP
ncbi:MAG: LysR family transcriptional regulator [Pigmentiphaga sp.]|nr:LysR family transcriptional regulator [Pigmentiphaga sp.]